MEDNIGRICFSQLPVAPGQYLPGIQTADEIDLKTMMEKMWKDPDFAEFGGERKIWGSVPFGLIWSLLVP